MAKYTKEQLSDMAVSALCARAAKSPRYDQLIATLQAFTGWHPAIIEQKIRELANV
ncbi:hypothetical protein vBAmaSR9Y3_45 [Alteromonas phage vB_AmaS-R9Y3]|nr:hypothetical protein vBAmaSR9Y3_45 [Alteromonas phage vB_AmaS-R9Y3]